MNKSARRTLAGFLFPLLLLLFCPAGIRAQKPAPAPKPSPPNESPATPPRTPAARDIHVRATETLIDESIPNDPAVTKMVAAYSPKVRELEVVIGKLKGELRKGGTGAGSMGNFVTDGMRLQAGLKTNVPVTVAIMNSGGMRRNTIGEGELRAQDIFELLPFENALITVDLTGELLMKLLGIVVDGREAQSGARLTYKINAEKKSELVGAKLLNARNQARDIDPKGLYTVVTIDYLYRVGGDRWGILRAGKNMKELGITLRDAIMNYVKSETASGREIKPNLDGRFVFDRALSAPTQEAPPQ